MGALTPWVPQDTRQGYPGHRHGSGFGDPVDGVDDDGIAVEEQWPAVHVDVGILGGSVGACLTPRTGQ